MFGLNRTYQGNNRHLTIMLLITFLLLVSGCTQNANTPETPSDDPPSPSAESETQTAVPTAKIDPLKPAPPPDLTHLITILNPSNFDTLYLNPISLSTSQQDVPGALWQSTFKIEGLKDESIQDAINNDLNSLYEAMEKADLPPYRGIYQRIPPGTPHTMFTLNASAPFNFENLLSVAIYSDKTYTFNDPTGERSEYIGRLETRNYDLRTGDKIPLPALFANPETAMHRINDEVAKMLSSQNSDEEPGFENGLYWVPRLTTPFKGLEANQKYYLQTNGIVLVFDHQTPDFDTGFYPAQITLPFNLFEGEIAIRQRFADGSETNPYLNTGARDQQFVQSDTFFSQQLIAGEETFENTDFRAFLHYRYPKDLPPAIQALVVTTLEESRLFVKSLKADENLAPGEEPYCEIALDITEVGPFYTLRHSVYTYKLTDGVRPATGLSAFTIREDQPLDLMRNPAYFASYDADGHRISLESCFDANVDYKALIAAVYNKQALLYGYPSVDKSQLENVIFSIGHTGFECFFPDLGDYGYMGMEYKDLGSENLTIFNE
ncbi:MAG: hypothetical protein GT601_14995 [Acidaminobacter sp.]|uniref:hypothetical protein n=1 Tax=Acidaminobacter sp. TaxID=1872102 RepID=UPI00137EAAD3|nr:hypothetical protein [Acidaminobacter sp.]MZQ98972.1 hypothetical protein [Acidaminobacter sp.]